MEPQADVKTVVVARPEEGQRDSYAVTAGNAANYIVQALSPFRVVVTRTVRVYLQSVSGLVTAGVYGADKIPGADGQMVDMLPDEFAALLWVAMKMSVAIAGVTAIQNATEIWKRIDQKHPEWRA